jgi:hypothetical protein
MQIAARRDGETWRSVPPRAANHLALIRRFCSIPTAADPFLHRFVQIFFGVSVAPSAKQIETKNPSVHAAFAFAFRSQRTLSMRARNPGFIDIFCKAATACAVACRSRADKRARLTQRRRHLR